MQKSGTKTNTKKAPEKTQTQVLYISLFTRMTPVTPQLMEFCLLMEKSTPTCTCFGCQGMIICHQTSPEMYMLRTLGDDN